MSIYFNGGANPEDIRYNGLQVDSVVYNGAEVWHRYTEIARPTVDTSHTYDTVAGTSVSPTISGYDSGKMYLSGDSSAAHSGVYTMYINIKDTAKYRWPGGSAEPIAVQWSVRSIVWIYNRTSGYADGASVVFVGNKGSSSGNYCDYADDYIYMEMKNPDYQGVTYKTATFNLYQHIPQGKTVYINVATSSSAGTAAKVTLDAFESTSLANQHTWELPNGVASFNTAGSVSNLVIRPNTYCMTSIYQIYWYE